MFYSIIDIPEHHLQQRTISVFLLNMFPIKEVVNPKWWNFEFLQLQSTITVAGGLKVSIKLIVCGWKRQKGVMSDVGITHSIRGANVFLTYMDVLDIYMIFINLHSWWIWYHTWILYGLWVIKRGRLKMEVKLNLVFYLG